jgi:hypothetical protein
VKNVSAAGNLALLGGQPAVDLPLPTCHTLPNAERACNDTAVLLSHTHLLGDRAYWDQIVNVVKKVSGHLFDVKRFANENTGSQSQEL